MIGGVYIEIVIVIAIIIYIFVINGRVDRTSFFKDNADFFKRFKEKDYDFYVRAKYGDSVDPDILFSKRIQNGAIGTFVIIFLMITNLDYITVVIAILIGYFVFKLNYMDLRKNYRSQLHEYDAMLPYYLKTIEILVQHYTVPVALGRSIDDAPQIFRKGLDELIRTINAGDSTIEPYMEFARTYPVRDSMRMMRLLYRLSLGTQENKQEQLLSFSRSISALQAKARETKYKNRLEKMESKTMIMLTATGFGVMILLVIAILNMIEM